MLLIIIIIIVIRGWGKSRNEQVEKTVLAPMQHEDLVA
jgi:hypothetical protein